MIRINPIGKPNPYRICHNLERIIQDCANECTSVASEMKRHLHKTVPLKTAKTKPSK